MTYYETYQNALNALGYPNAEIKSQGIWGGSRAYTFDDQESKTHITLFKNEHGWRFGGSGNIHEHPHLLEGLNGG